MREDFVGAVGLNQIARFRLDPRDERDDGNYYQLVKKLGQRAIVSNISGYCSLTLIYFGGIKN
jgi:succinate dehydrogenase/fumarate reductase-like Fe-S protein